MRRIDMEAWEAPKNVGKRVRVVRPIFEMEKALMGREFVLKRISYPHGYAVCSDGHGVWHLHPEALEMIDVEEEGRK
jgi:hypothetical protein